MAKNPTRRVPLPMPKPVNRGPAAVLSGHRVSMGRSATSAAAPTTGPFANVRAGRLPPRLISIDVDEGTTAGGNVVHVTGSRFLQAGAGVSRAFLDDEECRILSIDSDTSMTIRTAPHAAGTADLRVENGNGRSNILADAYNYAANLAPTLASIDPVSGDPTTELTLTGTGYTAVGAGASVVLLGTARVVPTIDSNTQARVLIPDLPTGTYDVVYANENGESPPLVGELEVVNLAPTLTGCSPAVGGAGTELTLTGTQFQAVGAGDFAIAVDGVAVDVGDVTVDSDTQIRVPAPAHANGVVAITLANDNGAAPTLANAFAYGTAPVLTSLTPATGAAAGGTAVGVVGSGFLLVSAGTLLVNIGGNQTAAVIDTATTAHFATPAHLAGAVDVSLENAFGEGNALTGGYTYA